jgi:hypothetical protein
MVVTRKPLLFVEPVPATCRFSEMRVVLSAAQYSHVEQARFEAAGNRCQTCGGAGPLPCRRVDLHEVWHYDDVKRVQTLLRFTALCPPCHNVAHLAMMAPRSARIESLVHIKKVNGWTMSAVEDHVKAAFDTWRLRSGVEWKTNLGHLAILFPGYRPPQRASNHIAEFAEDAANAAYFL